MKNRKWKRGFTEERKELPVSVPIPRSDRLSAIVPIDRICVESEVAEKSLSFAALCESVKQNGVLQPLLLRRICEEESPFGGLYLLVAGRRRLAAARAAGHRAVPCYIVTMDAKAAAVTAFVTDVERAERNAFELSDALQEMRVRFGMSVPEIAASIGKSEIYTAGKLLLQRFTAPERAYLIQNGVSEDIALVLLQIRSPERRAAAARQIVEKELTRDAAAEYVRSLLSGAIPSAKNALSDLRLFHNSVDRLMSALRKSGADATLDRKELACQTVITIRINHADATLEKCAKQ